MDRARALEIARKYCDKDITYRHLVATEGVMRALGRHFGQDAERWGFAGLWHDLDYDRTGGAEGEHAYRAVEWLRAEGYEDEQVLNAILAHLDPSRRVDAMSRSIVHADGVSGLLVACALVRPEKASGMKVSSVKKKLKEKSFAPGVERDKVRNVEEKLGIGLDEFLSITIAGLQEVAAEIDL